jgi:hypothetical protein
MDRRAKKSPLAEVLLDNVGASSLTANLTIDDDTQNYRSFLALILLSCHS